MFRGFSSAARRDMTVNIVVPTSGNLLVNRTSGLQVLQAAGERTHNEAASAQYQRRGQAALAGGAHQQGLAAVREQAGIRQKLLHGNVPRASGPLSDLLGGANINAVEAALSGRGEGVPYDLNGAILPPQRLNVRAPRPPALAAARGVNFSVGEIHEIHPQQLP